MEVKEEQNESENKFFNDSEGTEQLFISYEDVGKDIVKKDLHEIDDNYQEKSKVCENKTEQKPDLLKHRESVHEGIKQFKCHICDYETVQKGHLKTHINSVHEGIKPYKCLICDFKAARNFDLKTHIESIHEGIKPFKCELCDYKCARKYHLKTHIESIHEGIKPFKCDKCDFETAHKFHLKKHIASAHEEIKPFNCSICNYKTVDNYKLKFHTQSVHEGIKPFKCHICQYKSALKSALKRHIKSIHKKENNEDNMPKNAQEKYDFQSIKQSQTSDASDPLLIHDIKEENFEDYEDTPIEDLTGVSIKQEENYSESFYFHDNEMVEEGDFPEIGEVKKELMDEHFVSEDHITSDIDAIETNCEQFDFQHTEKDQVQAPVDSGHRKLKTFSCPLCNKMITKRNMKSHISVVHEGKKEFQCDACDTPPFAYKSNLSRHKSDHCTGVVVKPPPQEMTCELCLIELKDGKMLKSHMQEQHMAEGLYCCSHCDKKCKQFIGLKYHIDIKHPESSEKKFFCNQCNKGFIYNSSVGFHMSKNTCVKHKCDLCGIEYRTLAAFQMHMAKNHNTEEGPVLMCDKCDFSAPHKLLLQHHVLTKHDIDKHKKCPCCDFQTVKTQKLYIHIDNHHPEYGDKKFVCDKCGNNFIYESSLKHHANSRCKLSDRIKSHVCTSCDSTFQTIQGLKRHTDSVHEKLKPFTCTVCDQSFSRKNHMSVHMATVHEKQKPFRCDICETKFTSKSALKEHVFVIHEKNKLEKSYKCSLCDSQFQKSNKLHDHIKVVHEGEKFPCTICNKEFRSRGSLKVHIAGIHEDKNPYQCDLCGKRFHMQSKVTKHILMVHEKKSPYLCNNCDEGFLSKSLLQAHIKSLHELDTILEPKIIMNFTTEKPEKMPELKFGTSEDPRSLKVDQLTNKDSSVEFENGQINPKSLEIDPLRNNDYSVEFENAQINPRKSRITKQETVDYDVDPSKGIPELELKFGTTEVPRSLEIDPLRNKDYSDEFENAQINPRKRRITKQETEDYNDYQSKVHKGKKLYRCPHCGDSFDSRYNKKIHLNTVHNGENGSNEDKGTSTKICEHCGSSFASNYRLKRHVIAVHEGERGKKQCNICGKRVNQLQGHIRAVHDKVKPFICSICGYKCGKQHQLDNHMELVHDEKIVRSIQCSQCDASFKDESSLIKHVKHAHENLSVGKQLGCPFCSGIFIGQRGIFGHVELEHPNWIDSFINKSSLLRHVLLQSSNSQNINGTLEDTQEILVTPVDLEKVVKTENVKSQEYTDRKSFKNKKGETVVVLSLEEKAKLIADSKKPGFCRKEVVAKYGINNNTITNILKSEDKIRKIIESGQKQVIPRVRLSLQVKARLIEESKQPGFNKKEVAARYGINFNTVINILSNQDKVLKLIESGLGHKTNTNFGKEMHSSNSDKMSYQYRSSSHHLSIQK